MQAVLEYADDAFEDGGIQRSDAQKARARQVDVTRVLAA